MTTLAFLIGLPLESLSTTKLRVQNCSGAFCFFSPADRHRGTMSSKTMSVKSQREIFLMVFLDSGEVERASPE